MENLGSRLKQERQRLGLTQKSLAKIAGVELNAQGKYERGERLPRADYLQRLTSVGIDPLYVLNGMHSSRWSAEVDPTAGTARKAFVGITSQVTALLDQLSHSLRLTAQTIADVAEMGASGGSPIAEGDLTSHLRALDSNSEKVVQIALARAQAVRLKE